VPVFCTLTTSACPKHGANFAKSLFFGHARLRPTGGSLAIWTVRIAVRLEVKAMDAVNALLLDRETDFPASLMKARHLLLERIQADDGDGKAFAKLAEVQYWLGNYTDDSAEKEKHLAQGVEHGKRAAELAPDSVEANFWFVNCMAAHGLVRGMMNSLFYLKPMEKYGKKALALDEAFFDAAPLRLMGRYYFKVPPWPVGSGDKKKGVEMLERAVETAPDYLYNKVCLADAYLGSGRPDEARHLLEAVLDAPEPEEFKLNFAKFQQEARELMERLGAVDETT
jgi:tetratricopeptide (TPR) repeat protein